MNYVSFTLGCVIGLSFLSIVLRLFSLARQNYPAVLEIPAWWDVIALLKSTALFVLSILAIKSVI